MASLGEVATGAAHQLNQPLNIIRMAVANIRRQCHFDGEQGADGLDKLKRIDAQVERAAQIIEGMKAFSVRHHGDWTDLMVSDVVTRTLVKLKKQFAIADVEVVRETAPIDAVINSNAVAMETILQSLMGNSLDAFLDREVTGGCMRLAEYQGEEHYTLVMADNAGGIDGSSLDHIFEPFYTTKDASHRPGLGLAVVWRLVDEMGGSVHCENVDGGARFTLVLPLLNPTEVDLPTSA
jgi:C4-dicarboxylate-specific signal transduction histidine kinase